MSEHIRIYVADLAAYNAGYLHDVWIEVTPGAGRHTGTGRCHADGIAG